MQVYLLLFLFILTIKNFIVLIMYLLYLAKLVYFSLLNDEIRRSKCLGLGPSTQRTFQLSSSATFEYLLRSCPKQIKYKSLLLQYLFSKFLKDVFGIYDISLCMQVILLLYFQLLFFLNT